MGNECKDDFPSLKNPNTNILTEFPKPKRTSCLITHKNSTPVDRKWREETQNKEKSSQSHAIAILGIVAMFTW